MGTYLVDNNVQPSQQHVTNRKEYFTLGRERTKERKKLRIEEGRGGKRTKKKLKTFSKSFLTAIFTFLCLRFIFFQEPWSKH